RARALVDKSRTRIRRCQGENAQNKRTFLVLALELLDKVINQSVIKVLSSQVSITGCSLDLENTLFDSQQGHIEGTSTKIEDENVTLPSDLLVESVGDSSSGRF